MTKKRMRIKNTLLAPDLFLSSMRALKGATPVPGPIMMSGVEGQAGARRIPLSNRIGIRSPVSTHQF